VPVSGDSEDDCGEIGGMKIGKGNRSSRRKPVEKQMECRLAGETAV
jgi:hypothetical protein